MRLSKLVSRQIPAFIREEHPLFVKFIRKYYEFLEQNGFVDKDLSSESQINVLLEALANEVSYSIPKSISDQVLLLQNIKDVYLTKGSEESFRFLFRALFNKEIEFFYPSSSVLRTSDGEWVQDYSIFVRVLVGNPIESLRGPIDVLSSGNKVQINTLDVKERPALGYLLEDLNLGFVKDVVVSAIELGYTTETVESIFELLPTKNQYKDTVYEVFIDRDYYGVFKEDDVVISTGPGGDLFVGYVVSTTAKLKLHNRGLGFRPGHLIPIKTKRGNGSVLKVSSILSGGKIGALDFLSFGYEYSRPIVITATNDGQVKLIIEERAEFDDEKDFVTQISLEDEMGGNISRGYFLSEPDYVFEDDCVYNYEVINPGSGYTQAQVTFSSSPFGITALGTPIINYELIKELTGFIICNVSYDKVTPKNIVKGVGTKFISEVQVGQFIRGPGGLLGKIQSIQSNTQLTLESNATSSVNRGIGQTVFGYIAGINITRKGSFYPVPPTITITGNGTGAQLKAFTGPDYYWDIDYCGTLESRFSYNRTKRIFVDDEKAMIKLFPGPVAKYPGYYANNLGFLSDAIYLHDGKYYQDFSYVIQSKVLMDTYAPYIRTTLHPAGKILFGEYLIENTINIEDNVFVDKTIKTSYVVLTFQDFVGGFDVPSLDTNPVFENQQFVSDVITITDQGTVSDNPYSMPGPDKLWGDYTLGDVTISFD